MGRKWFVSLVAVLLMAQAPAPLVFSAEPLTLELAIEKALSKSFTIQNLKKDFRTNEINYDQAWDTMFLPRIELKASGGSTLTAFKIPGAEQAPPSGLTSTNEFGFFGLQEAGISLGRYTLFNFWRDMRVFEAAQLDWKRSKEIYNESVRRLRNEVTLSFFRYRTQLEKLSAAKTSVETAETIAELVKSRNKDKVSFASDLSSSMVDLLLAKNQLNDLQTQTREAGWQLNKLLGDPLNTEYSINEEIIYRPLKLTPDQAIQIYSELSPNVRNAKLNLKKSEINVELSEKARLPLPVVSFSGINVGYVNNYFGAGGSTFNGSPITTSDSPSINQTNMNISIGFSITVPILGPSGFLGGRAVEAARISRDKAEIMFREVAVDGQIHINGAITNILAQERIISNNQQALERVSELLSALVEQLPKGTISRMDLRDALQRARESAFGLSDSKLNHLRLKLDLSILLGVDHLPGDVY